MAGKISDTLTNSAEKIKGELDRLMDFALNQGEKALDTIGLKPTGEAWLSVDVIEFEEGMRVVSNVPGVSAGDIDVSLAGNMLTIKTDLPAPPENEHETIHLQERASGHVERAIALPIPVDPEHVSAEVHDGVLSVHLKKTAQSRAHHIPVQKHITNKATL